MKPTKPSNEQMAAIQRFAKLNGRRWKTVLWGAWMNGSYRYVVAQDGDAALLQQVRNQFGPAWLDKLRLPKTA